MRCFSCREAVALASGGRRQRVGVRDTCPGCDADLHVCRNCRYHDPGAHNECREPGTEWVGDRERANRCEDFAPAESAGGADQASDGRDEARRALDALFEKP